MIIFFACLMRNKNDDKEAGEHIDIDNFDFSNHEEQEEEVCSTRRPSIHFNRLNEAEVMRARNQRLKELHMWSIIRESFIYISFLIVLCFFTYSNRDQNAFFQVNHMRKFFFKYKTN